MSGNKRMKIGERGVQCIFVGYAKFSKTYKFYIIDHNELILVHSIIQSRDTIFDEK